MKNTEKGHCIEDFLNNEIQKCHDVIDELKSIDDKDNLNSAMGYLSALLLVQNFVNEQALSPN